MKPEKQSASILVIRTIQLVNEKDWDYLTLNLGIGEKDCLIENTCYVSQTNWLAKNIIFPCKVSAQIRYNSPVVDAEIFQEENQISVQFSKPQRAITPGQSIVFYEDDIVLGGGIIEKNIE